MGLIIGYFKCDPFEFNFRLLAFGGFWPITTKNRCVQILYTIYSFLCCFSSLSMLFIQILDVYLLRNDPLNLIQNLCSSLVTFGSILKYMLVFFKIEKVLHLHHQLLHFTRTRTDPDELEIIKKADRKILWSTKAFYSLAIPCVIAWMLYPGLESSEEKRVPFPYRLPIDTWKTPTYEILYTYQSMAMIGFLVNILSNDLIFYGFVIRINAQYDILINKILATKNLIKTNPNNNNDNNNTGIERIGKSRKYDEAVTGKVKETLKNISISHQEILRKIGQLKEIYCYPFFVHIFIVAVLFGIIIIDVIAVSKGFKLQILQRMTYTLCGIFDTYLICLYSTDLQEMSVKLFRSLYSTPWYKFHPKIKKELMVISMQSNKTPVIMVGRLFPLNLATFLQFIKISYNLTNLLYQTIRK